MGGTSVSRANDLRTSGTSLISRFRETALATPCWPLPCLNSAPLKHPDPHGGQASLDLHEGREVANLQLQDEQRHSQPETHPFVGPKLRGQSALDQSRGGRVRASPQRPRLL